MKATIIQFTWNDNGKIRVVEIRQPNYLANNPKAMQVVVTRAFLEMAIKDWNYLEICSEMGWETQLNHDTGQMGNPEDSGSVGKPINWDMKEWRPHKVFFDILEQKGRTTRMDSANYPKILQELAKARENA
tara:strand:- start:136 stop:528 length:393 start_codon:yes stop_codon:yes gene_type:complete